MVKGSALKTTFVLGSVFVVAATACSKTPPEPGRALDAGSAPGDASALVPDAGSLATPKPITSKRPRVAVDRTKHPLTADESKRLKAYNAGMAKGRAATRAKEFTAAISGFDDALAAKPDDARALSERGYAKLLMRDFKGASLDNRAASRLTEDKKILAQIWFNEGLVAESEGIAPSARMFFARSNALNPTKAAQAKLTGKSTCPASIDDKPVNGRIVASWLEVYKMMGGAYAELVAEPDERPTDAAAAKKLVCDGCTGSGPWIATLGDLVLGVRFVVAPVGNGQLAAFDVGSYGYGSCGGDYVPSLTTDGDIVRLSATDTGRIRVWVKPDKSGELVPCDDEAASDNCSSACADANSTREDFFFDVRRGVRVVKVSTDTDATHASLVTIAEKDGVVTVKGASCDETVKLR